METGARGFLAGLAGFAAAIILMGGLMWAFGTDYVRWETPVGVALVGSAVGGWVFRHIPDEEE